MFRKIEKQKTAALGSDKQDDFQSLLIKRKLLAVEIEIHAKGQYETFSQKLPFTAHKVLGVAICSSVNDLQESPALGKCYFGIGLNENISEIFIKSLESKLILPEWMKVTVKKCYRNEDDDDQDEDDDDRNTWTFYAQPKWLGNPVLKINGHTWKFRAPVLCSILDDATGQREDYYVWRSQENNLGEVQIEIIQQVLQP